MAKLILTPTDAGKTFPLGAGLNFDVAGTDGIDSIFVAKGDTAKLSLGAGVDLIKLEGNAADYTVAANGTLATFTLKADNTTVSMSTNSAGDTVSFGDGLSALLGISGGAVKLGSQILTATAAPVTGAASGGGGGTAQSLDGQGVGAPVTITTAATAAVNFTDSATVPNNVILIGFGTDDSLTYSGVTAAQLDPNISSSGIDVSITYNNNGVLSQVQLVGVNPSQGLVFDVASFNALPVGNILFA